MLQGRNDLSLEKIGQRLCVMNQPKIRQFFETKGMSIGTGRENGIGRLEQMGQPIQCGLWSAECGVVSWLQARGGFLRGQSGGLFWRLHSVMMMTGDGGERLKHTANFTEQDFFADKHLPDGRIVLDPQMTIHDGQRKMQIADLPREFGRLDRR